MVVLIGVDIGKTGAMVALAQRGKVLGILDFQDNGLCSPRKGFELSLDDICRLRIAIAEWLASLPPGELWAFIERPLLSPGALMPSIWRYLWYLIGIFQMVCLTEGIHKLCLVSPAVYKKEFQLISKTKGAKLKAHDAAGEVFSTDQLAALNIRKSHTGVTDAALIAEFARRLYNRHHGDFESIKGIVGL
jgi:hypothetical protein